MKEFEDYVRKHFGFLKDKYGFEEASSPMSYVKGVIELEFYHGKGEIEICFFIRKQDNTFKAFVSRSFDLTEIVQRVNGSYVPFPKELQGYVISLDDMDKHLAFYAKLTKKYCFEQLEGDLSLFEEIHLERRERKKNCENLPTI
jgi:hypothetical protein